jgi:hypothetical protein
VRIPVNILLAGTYMMEVHYASGVTRSLYWSVNDGPAPSVAVNSGGWDRIGTFRASVQLNAGLNTIRFFNNSAAGPDLDRLVFTGGGSDTPPVTRRFVFGMKYDATGEYDVIAATSDPQIINTARQELTRPIAERRMINGAIARGNNNNLGWSWHFVPNQWAHADMSIELCDGTPAHVEADLNYWVDVVGRYCPWSSYTKQELP